MKTIVFTGGGTAGHVTPNLALMDKLDKKEWNIHYIGTKEGIERQLIEPLPYVMYHAIAWGKLRRYFSWKNFTDPFRVLKGYCQARRILKETHPDVLFSKGGYVSVPVAAAARGLCPVLCHESDYTPGLANKLAARYADRICVTFEDTLEYVPRGKGVCTGTPVRDSLLQGDKQKGLSFAGLEGKKPVLLVMGGSSGAQALNEGLRAALPLLLPEFDVIHLCGKGKLDPKAAQPGYVQFEYIDKELPDLFAAADILLSRAGANAVFEFLALQKPALLVPLPLSASRGDQILNAQYFEKRGFALYLDQEKMTPKRLQELLEKLYREREDFAEAMKAYPNANGTENVLKLIFKAVEK